MDQFQKNNQGSLTPALLIIVGAFLTVIYAILFVLTTQFDYSNRQVGSDQAFNVAEAGINYYRWHLAHDPDDYQNGTGQPGPYQKEYLDPQGNPIGRYQLEITPPSAGSSVVTIRSQGWTYQYPNVKRTIVAQYGQPSFARYAFLQNSSSWYANGITINGLVHSNNGIRMDGVNLSLVTSAQEDYMCGNETGCHPPTNKGGIWGTGGDQGLWQFPVPTVDFGAISVDLAQLRTISQTEGLYLAPSNRAGYHIIFNNDGTFTVRRVNSSTWYRAYQTPGSGLGGQGKGGCRQRYQVIGGETTLGTYSIGTDPLIFAEDNVWIEGTIRGRVTVAAASFPIGSSNIDVWINGNITYTATDGSDVFGLISQNDIYFVRDVPNNFRVDGVLIAQQGSILRHGYVNTSTGNNHCVAGSYSIKNSLTINGSIISYDSSYWNFGTPLQSGFQNRTINYDTNVLYAPPPYFPTSGEYEFISWREARNQ